MKSYVALWFINCVNAERTRGLSGWHTHSPRDSSAADQCSEDMMANSPGHRPELPTRQQAAPRGDSTGGLSLSLCGTPDGTGGLSIIYLFFLTRYHLQTNAIERVLE